jgi:hypothetical protein
LLLGKGAGKNKGKGGGTEAKGKGKGGGTEAKGVSRSTSREARARASDGNRAFGRAEGADALRYCGG